MGGGYRDQGGNRAIGEFQGGRSRRSAAEILGATGVRAVKSADT